jgi:hypothetical protein
MMVCVTATRRQAALGKNDVIHLLLEMQPIFEAGFVPLLTAWASDRFHAVGKGRARKYFFVVGKHGGVSLSCTCIVVFRKS